MKLSQGLKNWAIENAKVAVGSDDATFKSAISTAITEEKLSPTEFAKLSSENPDATKTSPRDMLKGIIDEAMAPVNDRLSKLEGKGTAAPPKTPKTGKGARTNTSDEDAEGEDLDVDSLAKSISDSVSSAVATALKARKPAGAKGNDPGDEEEDDEDASNKAPKGDDVKGNYIDTVKLFGNDRVSDEKSFGDIRVKQAVERYSSTKSALMYPEEFKHSHLAGRRVNTGVDGHDLDTVSEQDKAVIGAWFKFSVQSAMSGSGRAVPAKWRMNEHDKQLVAWALHNAKFNGLVGYSEQQDEAKHKISNRKLNDFEIKAILDDSVSGGLEAAPIVFDDAVITTPLLFGELYPLINVINLPRGRRVEGFSIGNPTITSGTPEGTTISLFNTASFIAAFDTTIYNAVGAMELGLDFQEDSPVGIAAIVIQRYGEQFLAWLDEQIAIGDGTTEPQGVFNMSGAATINSDNGASGPPMLSDYEGLMFGLQKQFRSPADRGRTVFISNEVTYRRSRGMKVDPAANSTDERRLLGMEHENYITLGHSHKIHHNITNAQIAFINLRYYRMYRRLGLNVRIERGGKELALKNLELIVLRARFGGQMELGGAGAIMSDAQTT